MIALLTAAALAIGPPPPGPPSLAWGDPSHLWLGTGIGIYASAVPGTPFRRQSVHPGLALAAVDARHAWALADQGQTLRTTDGTHWTSLGVQHLLALSFANTRDGFALDRDGIFRRTRDGGATWKGSWGFRLQSVCFTDARTGWAARGGTVWTTHDGGTRWRARQLARASVSSLYCGHGDVWVVLHEGAAAGTEGYDVFASANGGTTWRKRYASPFVRGVPHVGNYSGPVAVLGDADAVLEGSCDPCGGGRGTVTIVHGEIRHTFVGLRPGPIAFGDPKTGLVALSTRQGALRLYLTRDAGESWKRVR